MGPKRVFILVLCLAKEPVIQEVPWTRELSVALLFKSGKHIQGIGLAAAVGTVKALISDPLIINAEQQSRFAKATDNAHF